MNSITACDSLSDLELLDLLKSGDEGAFALIYDRYFGLLYIHAYNRLKNKDEAKDLVQELFTHLWSKRGWLDPKTNLSNYLYTSTRNRVINIIAHKRVEDRAKLSLADTISNKTCVTDHLLRERQLTFLIESEIHNLPAKMREVFELSRKQNLTYKEIAVRLDLKEQSVRSHVKNALKILRVKLGPLISFFLIFNF
ncbi:RNA polymerase sigma-70 factor [Mucilaginibacter segetis]|uniref:RNA polymerase sigma-70 factor n=1 Tax=Mucilaginibacter segetis TaxID=2793071 RepID=A0A934PRT0_9SPHI|nr:RNA polymerase sigma-70 factor [Mucilaginibacter segetis]MBK0378452.1 RNA polymerase sigma-70 factor [Mucilaginibacter segetis]